MTSRAAALLDGNVLVALTVDDHLHHGPAIDWFVDWSAAFATCPITEGTLLRFLLRAKVPSTDAMAVLDGVRSHERHEFWPDDLAFTDAVMAGVTGHRQVTDAYLVGLARARGARLVTLDRALAALHGPATVHLLDPG